MRNLALSTVLVASVVLSACTTTHVSTPAEPMVEVEAKPKPVRKARTQPNPYGLSPYLLRQRTALVQGREIKIDDLKSIADKGDGFAAWEYAERLNALEDRSLTLDMVAYYAAAADSGRAGGIPRLVQLMNYPEFAQADQEQLDRLETLLRRYAIDEKNTQAALYLLQRYNLGTPFGDKSDQAVDLLTTLAESGDTRIALSLATQIMQAPDANSPEQLAEARRFLDIAMGSDVMSVKTTAHNLLALMDRRAVAAAAAEDTNPPPPTEEYVSPIAAIDMFHQKETAL